MFLHTRVGSVMDLPEGDIRLTTYHKDIKKNQMKEIC